MNKKINITKLLLFFVILSLENFCCLLPGTKYLIPNLIKYSDLGIIFSTLFIIWVTFFVKFIAKETNPKYPYKWLIIVFISLIIISSMMAKHFFNQPIFWGIRSQRQIIFCFLLYFPISKALQSGVITKEDIIKEIFIVATIELLLYTVQYIVIDKIVFLNFTFNDTIEMRLGMRRVRYPIELPLLASYISMNNILNNKKNKIINIAYVIWFATILITMVQKRTQIISFIISILLILVIWKKNIGVKLLITMIILPLLIGFFLNLSIIQSTVQSITNRGSKDDTLTIREQGIKYYKQKVKESPIFGFGFPNENSPTAKAASGFNYNYYIVDDGIYSFYYIFGISGIIWIIIFWIKNIKLSYKLYKDKKIYIFLLYFIYETADLYIGMKWYYYWPLAMALTFTLLSNEFIINKNRSVYNEIKE